MQLVIRIHPENPLMVSCRDADATIRDFFCRFRMSRCGLMRFEKGKWCHLPFPCVSISACTCRFTGQMFRFLISFANDHLAFRWPEVDAIVSLYNLQVKFFSKTSQPFITGEAKSEQHVKDLCSRCVLIKSAYELWHENRKLDNLVADLIGSPIVDRYSGQSFKVLVETYGKKVNVKYKVDQIEKLLFIDDLGPVDLQKPQLVLSLLERYRDDLSHAPSEPEYYYFGRKICDSYRTKVHKFNLSERKFISNTSMDPVLATLIANIAKVDRNHLVLDPFVGSGSLLVAAADFGAYVIGSDIDYKLLMGLSKSTRPNVKERESDENIRNNLRQYGLESQYIDILLSDASHSVIRANGLLDSIICDPPYGIRESSVKVGSKKADPTVPEECLGAHYPAKVQYNLADVILDLLEYSAAALRPTGRLVYWQPLMSDMQPQAPCHPAFDLVCICKQPLTRNTARVLICLERKQSPHHPSSRELLKDENAVNFKYSYDANVRCKGKSNIE